MDTSSSILKSAKHFFAGTMLSRITGMLRDISMAFAFGTSPAVAAFMLAFRFSHLPRRLFGEGSLQTAFIPQFEQLRKENSISAYRFFWDLSISMSFFLFGLIFFLSIGLIFLWSSSLFNPENQSILLFTLIMLPSLFFICLYGIYISLLQCEKHYFIGSVAPVAFNLIWILGVFIFNNTISANAMIGLSLFIVLACLGQWLFTVPSVIRILKKNIPNWSWKEFNLKSPNLKKLIKPLVLGLIGVAAAQVNSALDALFARFADPEGPAFLWYAIRIQQLPFALFGIALSGALLPPLSRAIKNHDIKQFSYFLDFSMLRCIDLLIPLSMGMWICGDAIIMLLYGRGEFGTESIINTTQCLAAYSIGLLPMAFVQILAPAFYAQTEFKIPAKISAYAVLFNIILNIGFIFGLGWGAVSIALATSLAAWANFIALGMLINRKLDHIHNTFKSCFSPQSIKVTIASVTAVFATFMLNEIIPIPMRNFKSQLFYFLLKGGCFTITFGMMILLLKADLETLSFFNFKKRPKLDLKT